MVGGGFEDVREGESSSRELGCEAQLQDSAEEQRWTTTLAISILKLREVERSGKVMAPLKEGQTEVTTESLRGQIRTRLLSSANATNEASGG